MTDAKLVTSPDQSGLTHSVNERVYADLIAGRTPGTIAVAGLLIPIEHGEKRTSKGTKRFVRYDFLRLEPVADTHDADQIAWQVTRAYEQRTGGSQQQAELFPAGPAEQREQLIRDLAEWAEEEGVTDLDDRWLSYFGGSEHAASATPKAGSLVQLMEFARYCGAIVDEQLTVTPTDSDDDDLVEAREGYEGKDEELDDEDGDPDAQPAALASPFLAPEDQQ